MIILQTKRLILRTWQDSDLEPMTAINLDPKVYQYLLGPTDKAKTLKLINKWKAHYQQHGFCLYAVELKSTKEMIGFVGLNYPSFDAHFTPAVEIGWRLASLHWNQGYATEAAEAVLAYALNELKLNEVISFTVTDNLASRRVMEKIGLKHDPKDNFDYPGIDQNSPLCRHVLYRA